MEASGGALRDSFEYDVTVSDFTAPVAHRERMDTIHAPALTINVSILCNLEKERPSQFRLTVFAVHMLDEEHVSLLVELDFAVDKIRSHDLNRSTSGFLRYHVDRFLWKRAP